MSASDPLIDVCVAGLDLVPVEMAITAAGAAIGPPPIAGVMQAQSVILYCKRHRNIERMVASVRSEFANIVTQATFSELVSAVLNSAALFGISILTETEVRIMASEAIAKMETELSQLQSAGGLLGINRSVQNDAAAAETGVPLWYRTIFSWLDRLRTFARSNGEGRWRDHLAILHRAPWGTLNVTVGAIGPRLADALYQSGEFISKLVKRGERLTIGLLRHLSVSVLGRRTKATRRVVRRR